MTIKVKAAHYERISVEYLANQRDAVTAYLRKNGWYIRRDGEKPLGDMRYDRKVRIADCEREDVDRYAGDLADEVKHDLGGLK